MIVQSKNKQVMIKEQDPKERIGNFNEVVLGYSTEEAKEEASRCLSCPTQPCVNDCPVNIDIPKFIKEIVNDNIDKAYNIIHRNNSFPGVCGRVCPQEKQCQMNCLRGIKGEPISIGNLERFVADNYVSQDKNTTKKFEGKVAIIGSGPAGLACAGYLLDRGIEVTIFEALHALGGVMRYGIPEFRLPKDILDNEINVLVEKGLIIEKNTIVGLTIDINELFNDGFSAIFLGLGAGSPRLLNIPGEHGNGVYSANEFLTRVNLMKAYKENSDTPLYVGEKILVIGGGNVALDAARAAKRLTDGEVTVVYRRRFEDMPARQVELHHSLEEGIKVMTQLKPIEITLDDNWVKSLVCKKMVQTGEIDKTNRPVFIEDKEEKETIVADTIIVAIGQTPNPIIKKISKDLKFSKWNTVIVDDKLETSIKNVFAGGDIITGASTVISAISAGKKAAESIFQKIANKGR
ncbi:MAG: NADPH-dependent glutamate synthase [Clostridia bacterium]